MLFKRIRGLILLIRPTKKQGGLAVLVLLLIIVVSLLMPPQARAGVTGALDAVLSPQNAIYSTIAFAIDLVFQLLSRVVALLGGLVDVVLRMDNFAQMDSIKDGWRLLRDFANMSFVIILLVMAFATIFGFESYGMKKLLPRLVIAALLINFSLAIAGFVVDTSQYFSRFFIKAGVSGSGVSATLARGLSIQRLLRVSPSAGLTDGGLLVGLKSIIEGAVMGSAVLLGVGFTFAILSFMLFCRIIVLWLLLVISPFVVIAWIVPSGQKYWKKWREAFLKWTFFAPAYCFFLYLALVLIQNDTIVKTFKHQSAELQSATSALNYVSSFFEPTTIIAYILIIGILIGGLYMANMLGIAGAKGAWGLVEKGHSKATDWAKATRRRVGMAAAERTLGAAAAVTAGVPLLGRATKLAHLKTAEARQAEQRKAAEKTKGLYKDDDHLIAAYIASPSAKTRAYLLEAISDRGILNKLEEIDKEKKTKYMDRVKQDSMLMERFGANKKNFLKVYPHLAEASKQREIVEKYKPAELAKMATEAWEDANIQKLFKEMILKPDMPRFDAKHLKTVIDSEDTRARQIVGNTLEQLLQEGATLPTDVVDYLKSPAARGGFKIDPNLLGAQSGTGEMLGPRGRPAREEAAAPRQEPRERTHYNV